MSCPGIIRYSPQTLRSKREPSLRIQCICSQAHLCQVIQTTDYWEQRTVYTDYTTEQRTVNHFSPSLYSFFRFGALYIISVKWNPSISPSLLSTSRHWPIHSCTDGIYRSITAAKGQSIPSFWGWEGILRTKAPETVKAAKKKKENWKRRIQRWTTSATNKAVCKTLKTEDGRLVDFALLSAVLPKHGFKISKQSAMGLHI